MIAREKKKGRILPAHMDGGIDNPLGARALYIGARMYRIHGSNEPWTIGSAVSSGCIRMTNDDVIDLYTKVSVGTRVVVLSGSSKQYIPFNPPVVASAKIPPKDVTEAPTKDDIVGTVPPASATAPAERRFPARRAEQGRQRHGPGCSQLGADGQPASAGDDHRPGAGARQQRRLLERAHSGAAGGPRQGDHGEHRARRGAAGRQPDEGRLRGDCPGQGQDGGELGAAPCVQGG